MKRRSLTTEAETRESVWGLSFCRLIDPSLLPRPAVVTPAGPPPFTAALSTRGAFTWGDEDVGHATSLSTRTLQLVLTSAGCRASSFRSLSLSLLSRANVSLNNSLPQSGHSSVCLLRYTQRSVRLAPPRDSAEKPKIRFLSFDGSKHLAIETDLVTLIRRAQTCVLFPR